MNVAFAYDALASGFERQRPMPEGVPQSVRAAVLSALDRNRPQILDLGAGTGRFGRPFVVAGDDYVGVDMSAGMLHNFAERLVDQRPMLVQADGRALPFPTSCFDLVLLISVFGNMPDWQSVVEESRRVLRPCGTIAVGRRASPEDGIDACLKQHLDTLLEKRMPARSRENRRQRAMEHLAASASATTELVPASWVSERSPRQFLDRHAGGARFSQLPLGGRVDALRALAIWAEKRFGSLDATFFEAHRLELQLFRFEER
jgi:ubiquinone/menaquinone biosynthesis C-methylase UbiE